MRLMIVVAIALFANASMPCAARAQEPDATPDLTELLNSSDFLLYHPDLGDRKMGLDAYKRGDYEYAARYFHWAARFADKASQAMLGSMYWSGQGVPQDRVLGCAWMDLAAERGYPNWVAFRERYWNELSADERKRAIEVGQPLYAEYGDTAAKPRLAVLMRRGRLQTTGSHTGFIGSLEIQKPGGKIGSGAGIDGNQYYASRYWEPHTYWAQADKLWKGPPKGVVNVGALETVPNAKPAPEPPQVDDGKSDASKH